VRRQLLNINNFKKEAMLRKPRCHLPSIKRALTLLIVSACRRTYCWWRNNPKCQSSNSSNRSDSVIANTASGVLFIQQGKGKKDRFVPIGERALLWLDKYKNDVRPYHHLPRSPDGLFLHETGKALDPHKVSRAVKKYVKQANIDKVGSCHLFRHTMATLMLENGADIRFI
jgi:hypothetical protein